MDFTFIKYLKEVTVTQRDHKLCNLKVYIIKFFKKNISKISFYTKVEIDI